MLPHFRYHPDPIATGSIEESDQPCACCGEVRGYLYVGPVFSEQEVGMVCPWCIASGAVHEKFDAELVDEEGVGGYGEWDKVPQSVVEEIAYRTPSFLGWQQEKWFTCCGDGAAFLDRAGAEELRGKWAGAVESIRESSHIHIDDWPETFDSLDKYASPTAYVFQCLHCGKLGGYLDFD